jgi:quinol monooxygenase YgiN
MALGPGLASRGTGYLRVEVLQQGGRPDHFVVLEAWRDQQAFDTHRMAANTVALLDRLQPLRVSPSINVRTEGSRRALARARPPKGRSMS